MTAARRRAFFVAAGVALLVATRFLARQKTFWEWDDFIFGLALHRFAPDASVPQAPYYPGFVGLGRFARLFLRDDVSALTAVSACASVLAVLAVFGIAKETVRSTRAALSAAAMFAFFPAVWFHAGVPLSDDAGLAASLGALWAALAARRNPRLVPLAVLLFGAAVSIRPQDALVAAPAVLIATPGRKRFAVAAAAAGTAFLLYAVPILAAARGFATAIRGFGRQAGYVLATDSVASPGRGLGHAIGRYALGIWGNPWLGAIVLFLASAGAVGLWRTARDPSLAILAASFFPYAGACVLFLDPAVAGRYILPALPLAAILAAAATTAIESRILRRWPVVSLAVAAAGAAVAAPAVAVLHTRASPPVEAAARIREAAGPGGFSLLRPRELHVAAALLLPGASELDAETIPNTALETSRTPVWRYGIAAFGGGQAAWPPLSVFSTVGRGRYLVVPWGRWKPEPRLGAGWFAEEQDGGERFRWMSARAEILPPPGAEPRSVLLTLVTSPRFFPRPPRLTVSWGGAPVGERTIVDRRTLVSCRLPPSKESPNSTALVLASDETFNPKSRGGNDDRELSVELRGLEWGPSRRP